MTIFHSIASVAAAFSLGIIAETQLRKYGISTDGLGSYVTAGVALVILDTSVKFLIILGWISTLGKAITTKSDTDSVLEFLGSLEEASNSSSKTFGASIKAIGMIFLATIYLINSNEPQIADSLTISWARDYPLVVGATAVAVGVTLTNSRTVWYLLGDGWMKRIAVLFGRIKFAFLLGVAQSAATVTAIGYILSGQD